MKAKRIIININSLVPTQFENKLIEASIYKWDDKEKTSVINDSFIDSIVIIDLNHLRWVDPSSLVQLILIIEDLLRQGINIYIAFPLTKMSSAEKIEIAKKWLSFNDVNEYIKQRQKVISFLQYLQFTNTLTAPHIQSYLGKLVILYEKDISDTDTLNKLGSLLDEKIIAYEDRSYKYKDYYPLTWLSLSSHKESEKIESFLSNSISGSKEGIEKEDARDLSKVIINELLENVFAYSKFSQHALVTARIWPETKLRWNDQYLESEKAFLNWLENSPSSLAEVIVGDSGVGIYHTLEKRYHELHPHDDFFTNINNDIAKVLLWSFDRFSTSKRNENLTGTRGLYNIDRIVQRNEGFVSLRSSNQFVGYDHGGFGYNEYFSYSEKNKGLVYIPGNVLSIRMPAFKEVKPTFRRGSKKNYHTNFSIMSFSKLDKNGLSIDDQEKISLKFKDKKENFCLVGYISEKDSDKQSIVQCLIRAIEIRHPGALVITGLHGAWDKIEGYIHSINEDLRINGGIAKELKKNSKTFDPVLVFENEDKYAWVGAFGNKLILLNELSSKQRMEFQEFSNLFPDKSHQNKLRIEVDSDSALFRINNDESIELNFRIVDILDFVEQSLEAAIKKDVSEASPNSRFRTPSLNVIKKWLSLSDYNDKIGGEKLLALTLFGKIIRSDFVKKKINSYEKLRYKNKMVICENNSNKNIAEFINNSLGFDTVKQHIVDYDSPLNFPKLLESKSIVIIYIDVISSGESVRDLLKQIRIDHSIPIVIVTIVNGMHDVNTIEVWGEDYPIISVVTTNLSSDTVDKNIQNLDPISYQIEEEKYETLPNKYYEIPDGTIENIIIDNSSLYFSHIKRNLGRHFTYFLNPDRIMNDPEIIATYHRLINEWKENNSIPYDEKIIFSFPSTTMKINPIRTLITNLKKDRNDIIEREMGRKSAFNKWLVSINIPFDPKTKNLILLDWGIITGSTLTHLMSSFNESGYKNILALIFMSQVSNEEEKFLRSIHKLKSTVFKETTLHLSFQELQKKKKEKTSTISVKFLTNLPIFPYTYLNCPICKKNNYYSSRIPLNKELTLFTIRQHEKYKEKEIDELRSEIKANGIKYFEGDDASSQLLYKNLHFRERLRRALASTSVRKALFDELVRITTNINWNDPSDEIRGLFVFFSVETEWLKKPPFKFIMFREIICNVALKILTNSNLNSRERFRALLVLHSSSQIKLISHISKIFESARYSEEIIYQLLFDIISILSKDYHHNEKYLSTIFKQLEEVKKIINENPVIDDGIKHSVKQISYLTEKSLANFKVSDITPWNAWIKLKELYKEKIPTINEHFTPRDYYLNKLILPEFMKPRIEKLISLRVNDSEKNIELPEFLKIFCNDLYFHWNTSNEFLELEVFPLLRRMKSILESKAEIWKYHEIDLTRIVDLLDEQGLRQLKISKIFKNISIDPQSILNHDNLKSYYSEIKWFWEIFFNTDLENNNKSLLHFLNSAPIDPIFYLNKLMNLDPSILNLSSALYNQCNENTQIFCPSWLFEDILEHILTNLKRHANKEDIKIRLDINIFEDDDYVVVQFENDNTSKSKSPGNGLNKLTEKLTSFYGYSRVKELIKGGWQSFIISFYFIKA